MGDTIVIETPVATVLEVSGKQGPQGPIGPQGPSGEASGSIAWSNVTGKPSTFTPSAHTHISADVTDFASAVVAAAPPTTNASLLTSGTLADARLSAAVTTLLGKADTASQPGHTHAVSDVTGLQTALDGKQATGSYAAASHTHTPSEVGLSNVSNTAQVTSVTGTAPIVSSGGTTPAISIQNSPTLTGDVIIDGASTGVSGSLKVGNTTGSFNRDVEIGGSGIVLRNVGGSGRTTIALGQGSTSNYTLTPPAASGTIALTSDIPSTFAASAVTSGVFDNARINFAAPSAIGSTTAAAITGTTGTFTTLSANNGTITASAPVLDLAQTWNNAAVTFTGLRVNATNTASATASVIADFQTGGTSRASIRQDGRINCFQVVSSDSLISGLNVVAATSSVFTWSGADLQLFRDAADILAQRRLTNPQTYRLYSTFTSTTSFERLNVIAQTGGSFIIGTEKGSGGGTARGLELRTDNVARITIGSAGQLGFFGATAAAQPTAVADATDAASTQARLNDLLARLRTIGIIAT